MNMRNVHLNEDGNVRCYFEFFGGSLWKWMYIKKEIKEGVFFSHTTRSSATIYGKIDSKLPCCPSSNLISSYLYILILPPFLKFVISLPLSSLLILQKKKKKLKILKDSRVLALWRTLWSNDGTIALIETSEPNKIEQRRNGRSVTAKKQRIQLH